MTDNLQYLITTENRNGAIVGRLYLKGKKYNVFQLWGNHDKKRFNDGFVCDDLRTAIEILEGMFSNAKGGRIQGRMGRHGLNP